MQHPLFRVGAATAASLVAVTVWFLFDGRLAPAHEFQQFANAVVQAKSAKFQMEVTVEGQPTQKFQAYYLAPDKFRQELGSTVNIADLAAGKFLTLIPPQKMAMVMNQKKPEGAAKNKPNENYFVRMRELLAGSRDAKDDQYVRLGEKEIDSKKTLGFRYDAPMGTATLWGDPKTGQPVRIENVWSGLPHTETVMTGFEFGVKLENSLFDLTPPAGYKVHTIDVDTSPPVVQDLVEAFRVCGDLGGGEFPETMDTTGITKLVTKYALSHAKDISDDKVQGLMKESIKIGRGFMFALELPESANAHYAGKGVKRDAKDKPIFWYKPAGKEGYSVLYADLKLADSATAPEVPGAVRFDKASKAAKP